MKRKYIEDVCDLFNPQQAPHRRLSSARQGKQTEPARKENITDSRTKPMFINKDSDFPTAYNVLVYTEKGLNKDVKGELYDYLKANGLSTKKIQIKL